MAERKSLEELQSIASNIDSQIAARVTHLKSGKVYQFGRVVFREHDLEPLVLYFEPWSPVSFARPWSEFRERFDWAGKQQLAKRAGKADT